MPDALMLHGGDVDVAIARFGGERADWLDLSTGINPTPWPGVSAIPVDWHALPSPAAIAALEAAAAAHFGIDPAHVCALPGSELGMRLLGRVLGGPGFHPADGYRTHAEMFPGSTPIEPGTARGLGAATLVVANPANPTGTILPRAALAQMVNGRLAGGGWLVVDEAFGDAVPGTSIADLVAEGRPLALFRSFGKFFGLAGLRLGFLLGPEPLLARMRTVLGSWPISAAAVVIGTAAYRDRPWIATMTDALPQRAARLDALLARHGLTPRGGCPLFRLLETGHAAELFVKLARHRILSRPFAARPQWLRLGVPADAAALERLDRALGDG